MNLLESAGFSRANPYYIVKQGNPTSHLPNVRIGTPQNTVSWSPSPFYDPFTDVFLFWVKKLY